MICDKKTTPSQPFMEYLRIFVAYINELAVMRDEKNRIFDKNLN